MLFLRKLLLLFATAACLPSVAPAQVVEFELPSVLSSGCVLQRNTRTPLWGKGQPGQNVSAQVSWSGKTYSGRVRPDGNWWIPVPTPEAGGPYTIALRCMTSDVVIENVLIGEVWVCSGQSNMEMPVAPIDEAYTGVDEYEEVLANAGNPQLRLFTVKNELSLEVQPDCEGSWAECSPESLREFSSTAYFFGSELQRELDIPIGVISADYGGSRAEAWMSAQAISAQPGFEDVGGLLRVPAKNETVDVEGLQAAAAHAWSIELARRDALKACEWFAVDEVKMEPDWRGLLRCRFAVTSIAEMTVSVERPAAIELSWVPNAPWCLVHVNGVLLGTNDPTSMFVKQSAPLLIPIDALQAGENQFVVSVLSNGAAAGVPVVEDLFDLKVSESGEALELADLSFSCGLDLRDFPTPPNYRVIDRSTPTALFNAMIAPIMPYGMRGVIWYQGESNIDRPLQYRTLFPALIREWRGWWRQGDFPFYFAQLAPFAYEPDRGRPAELRDAQRDALGEVPNTGMAVTLDIGNAQDIHPKNKRELGRRLALWALAKDYGREGLVYSGPLDTRLEIEGNELRVHFDHLGGGLVAAEGGLRHFELAGPDLRWHPATAEIGGDTVLVRSDAVPNPKRVRYCGGAADEGTLFNREGLPAPSFIR